MDVLMLRELIGVRLKKYWVIFDEGNGYHSSSAFMVYATMIGL